MKDKNISEITKSDKRIITVNDFKSRVAAGYEASYLDCEGCIPHCETPDRKVFSEALKNSQPSKLYKDQVAIVLGMDLYR